MIRFFIYLLILFSQFSVFSQERKNPISQIETIDSLLIGKKIKRAIKFLEIDSNWTVIHEPPGVVQGIWIKNQNGYSIQLITKRIPLGNFKKKRSGKPDYSIILKHKIIGVSWETDGKCCSVGKILPQYAYDRYGPCD